jgi:predicted DNA-binding antitoxin AbrB/MazE fold protein
MSKRLEAVYENGVFRPLMQLEGIPEHARVILTVADEEHGSSLREVAGSISAYDAEEMRRVVEREFERVDSRDWR